VKILSLTITLGMGEHKFIFPSGVNIVYSEENSVGKTSLLRMIMFSLGYAIPGTRGLDFNRFEFDIELQKFNGDICHVLRRRDYITYACGSYEYGFSLPSDLNELHKLMFNITNNEVLDNLLGAYYVDQEKGWTLLNRGTPIGKNYFNIDKLIRGLSNRSSDDLEMRLSVVERELQKYRHMFDLANYQAEINILGENIAYDSPIDEIEKSLDILYSEKKPLSDELERLKKVIRRNNSFKKYIADMKIMVCLPGGEKIPVDETTIVGFNDDVEYLNAKRKMVELQVSQIDKKIENFQKEKNKENTLVNIQTSIQSFDADVSKMKLDSIQVGKIIKNLENEKNSLKKSIKKSIRHNNPIITELHTMISDYARELDIDETYVRPSVDYIFTKDLKSLSGAIFHKIVFAFKISYIKLIGIHTGEKLPIILDSPSGREVDKINVADMMLILARDFGEHQIIIASIHDYDFPSKYILEIKDRLLPF